MADLPIPKVINSLDVDADKAYEPPYAIRWGVNRESTGTDTITMGRTIIPPGGRNGLHFQKKLQPGSPPGAFRLLPEGLRPRPGEPGRVGGGRAHLHLRRDAQQGGRRDHLRGRSARPPAGLSGSPSRLSPPPPPSSG